MKENWGELETTRNDWQKEALALQQSTITFHDIQTSIIITNLIMTINGIQFLIGNIISPSGEYT